MRIFNTTFKTLTGVSALLACGVTANAQSDIVNTIGNGSQWNIGQTYTASAPIGFDANSSPNAPASAATSGYAVLPFTIANDTSINSISEVDIVFNAQTGTSGNTNLPSLSGAIVAANASNSLSLTGLSSGDFFSFDTTPNNNPLGAANGDGITHIYSATNFGSYNLTKNQTYWLVIAPKAGLAAQAGDTLLDYGLWNNRLASAVTTSGGSLTNSYATVAQGLAEQQGANAGDTLTGTRIGRNGGQPAYFGARISGTAVPEPSSVLALAGGVLMAGGLLARRRK